MIRHVVIWRFQRQPATGDWHSNLIKAKALLDGMQGRLPGVLRLETGINQEESEEGADLLLLMDFQNRDALDMYRNHPVHLEVIAFLRQVRSERRVIDYEIPA